MDKFIGLTDFGYGPVAVFESEHPFHLSKESLLDRINNMKRDQRDVKEEEQALAAIEEREASHDRR